MTLGGGLKSSPPFFVASCFFYKAVLFPTIKLNEDSWP